MSLVSLQNAVIHLVRRGFEEEKTFFELLNEFNQWHDNAIFTATGNRRYPKWVSNKLDGVFYATREIYLIQLTEFGYWEKGVFYSTHKNTKHRQSSELHNKLLPPDYWNSIKKGRYYSASLKPFFED